MSEEFEKKEITRRIWIRKLKINLVLKNFPDAVHDIEIRISKLASYSKLDLHDMALELVIAGIEAMEQAKENELDDQHTRLIALWKEQNRIADNNKLLSDLMPVFQARGPESFEEWCQENSYDAQRFYDLYRESLEKLSWSKRAKAWINLEVTKAKRPIPLDEFKTMAKEAGIVNQNEVNWEAFYKHVQRLGYAGNPHGHVFDE